MKIKRNTGIISSLIFFRARVRCALYLLDRLKCHNERMGKGIQKTQKDKKNNIKKKMGKKKTVNVYLSISLFYYFFFTDDVANN